MRAAVALALVGVATSAIAAVQPDQLHKDGAVAAVARHEDVGGIFFEMEATRDQEVEATSEPPIVSDARPEQQASWARINTTVTVDAPPVWKTNATNTPATPLPTDGADPTGAEPTEVTGGALPQPMKASAAGLLGFFIMSLVML